MVTTERAARPGRYHSHMASAMTHFWVHHVPSSLACDFPAIPFVHGIPTSKLSSSCQTIRPPSRTASATRSAMLAESAQKATHPRADIALSQSSWPGVGRLPGRLVSISQWRAVRSIPPQVRLKPLAGPDEAVLDLIGHDIPTPERDPQTLQSHDDGALDLGFTLRRRFRVHDGWTPSHDPFSSSMINRQSSQYRDQYA